MNSRGKQQKTKIFSNFRCLSAARVSKRYKRKQINTYLTDDYADKNGLTRAFFFCVFSKLVKLNLFPPCSYSSVFQNLYFFFLNLVSFVNKKKIQFIISVDAWSRRKRWSVCVRQLCSENRKHKLHLNIRSFFCAVAEQNSYQLALSSFIDIILFLLFFGLSFFNFLQINSIIKLIFFCI